MSEWVRTFESKDGSTLVEDLGGVSWHETERPRRLHKCSPQTRGWTGYFNRVLRCACGAISSEGRNWHEKNSRRRKR